MLAAVYYENGPPEVFKIEEVPDPVAGPGMVVVEVEAISIEGGDTLNRLQGELASAPHIVGYQAAGTIVGVGEGVTNRAVGDRVVAVNEHGSHAELMLVPAATTWVIPEGADINACAAVPIAYGTAHDCLFEFGRLAPGETVLVQAGAGGVGVGAIQMAKRAGARVIATASSPDRLAPLFDLGLDHAVDYSKDGWVQRVRDLTGGKGVDLVLDPVGGAMLQQSVACLGHRGRAITIGVAGRDFTKFDPWVMVAQNQSLTGVYLGGEITTPRVHRMVQDLINDVAAGRLTVLIDRTFALSEAARAHSYIEGRKATGRVLLIPGKDRQ